MYRLSYISWFFLLNQFNLDDCHKNVYFTYYIIYFQLGSRFIFNTVLPNYTGYLLLKQLNAFDKPKKEIKPIELIYKMHLFDYELINIDYTKISHTLMKNLIICDLNFNLWLYKHSMTDNTFSVCQLEIT